MRKFLSPSTELVRHRHAKGYIAIVLKGSYLELGDRGSQPLAAGEAMVHYPFEAHRNLVGEWGAELINIPLSSTIYRGHRFLVRYPDAIVRALERGSDAELLFWESAESLKDPSPDDWVGVAAKRLAGLEDIPIYQLADELGVCPETFARTFGRRYGVTPHKFREQCRVQKALHEVLCSDIPLAQIAASFDFADQPHMTRNIRKVCGSSPGALRAS